MARFACRLARVFVLGAVVMLMLLAHVESAQAQPYPVRFYGASGKTSGFTCVDFKVVSANSPDSTSCWALVVWYSGTWFGFNNYKWAYQALWSPTFACPNFSITHNTEVYRTGTPSERLKWASWIDPSPDPGYVSYVDGYVLVNGGLYRNLALAAVDPSKCL